MAIITPDPKLKEKRMLFIEEMAKLKMFIQDFDYDLIEWGMLIDNDDIELKILTAKVHKDFLDVTVLCGHYEESERELALDLVDKYIKDTLGAVRDNYEFQENSGWYVSYTIEFDKIGVKELIHLMNLMEKKINRRGPWSTV